MKQQEGIRKPQIKVEETCVKIVFDIPDLQKIFDPIMNHRELCKENINLNVQLILQQGSVNFQITSLSMINTFHILSNTLMNNLCLSFKHNKQLFKREIMKIPNLFNFAERLSERYTLQIFLKRSLLSNNNVILLFSYFLADFKDLPENLKKIVVSPLHFEVYLTYENLFGSHQLRFLISRFLYNDLFDEDDKQLRVHFMGFTDVSGREHIDKYFKRVPLNFGVIGCCLNNLRVFLEVYQNLYNFIVICHQKALLNSFVPIQILGNLFQEIELDAGRKDPAFFEQIRQTMSFIPYSSMGFFHFAFRYDRLNNHINQFILHSNFVILMDCELKNGLKFILSENDSQFHLQNYKREHFTSHGSMYNNLKIETYLDSFKKICQQLNLKTEQKEKDFHKSLIISIDSLQAVESFFHLFFKFSLGYLYYTGYAEMMQPEHEQHKFMKTQIISILVNSQTQSKQLETLRINFYSYCQRLFMSIVRIIYSKLNFQQQKEVFRSAQTLYFWYMHSYLMLLKFYEYALENNYFGDEIQSLYMVIKILKAQMDERVEHFKQLNQQSLTQSQGNNIQEIIREKVHYIIKSFEGTIDYQKKSSLVIENHQKPKQKINLSLIENEIILQIQSEEKGCLKKNLKKMQEADIHDIQAILK